MQCDHSEAIESGSATPIDRQGRENAVFGNYLAGEVMPRYAAATVVIAVENYAFFVWGSQAVPQ